MRTSVIYFSRAILVLVVLSVCTIANAQVKIEKTAQKVGGYSYTTTSNRPNGTWNNEMGYGLCNAFAALSAIVSFNDRTVSSDQTVSGWVIQSENVTVTNGAKLTFKAGEAVVINSPFIINAGSQLEMSID